MFGSWIWHSLICVCSRNRWACCMDEIELENNDHASELAYSSKYSFLMFTCQFKLASFLKNRRHLLLEAGYRKSMEWYPLLNNMEQYKYSESFWSDFFVLFLASYSSHRSLVRPCRTSNTLPMWTWMFAKKRESDQAKSDLHLCFHDQHFCLYSFRWRVQNLNVNRRLR